MGQQLYVIGLPDPAVLDYTLQDVVNIQCDAIPSNCSLPVQPLQALVDALGTAATISISSAMRNTEVEMATSVSLCLALSVYAQVKALCSYSCVIALG